MDFEKRAQAFVDEGNHSLPLIFIPAHINKDSLLTKTGLFEFSASEKDVFKALAFILGESPSKDGTLISIDDICNVLSKSQSAIKRGLMSAMKSGYFNHTPIKIRTGHGIRTSKYFELSFPDIDTLNKLSKSSDELPTFIQGTTMFAPLKRGEEVNTALMDEIISGILAPCLHLQQKGNRKEVLVNVVTLLNKKIQVTTRGLSGIDIAHALDLRYYIAILSCVERMMRGAVEENTVFTETFALPISDVVRATGKMNESGERKAAVAAINRLRSTTFELSDMPEEITQNYDIETDAGLWTIDPLSNVSFSKLDSSNGQQIVSFQLPNIIVSALQLRSKQKAQSILRLISPVMYKEKNLLFVFLLQVRRLIQHGQEQTVPWYLMRDYSSPSMDIIPFKKKLSQLLNEHKGATTKLMSKDNILTEYEGNISGFNIKIDGSNFILSFDPNDETLIDPLFSNQSFLLGS